MKSESDTKSMLFVALNWSWSYFALQTEFLHDKFMVLFIQFNKRMIIIIIIIITLYSVLNIWNVNIFVNICIIYVL